MDARNNLEVGCSLIIKNYNTLIRESILERDRPVFKVIFYNEVNLYIRYNNYEEYSYCVIFSPNPDDQMQFDNYDDIWDVKTRPHHFHIRGMQSVIDSLMNEEPNHDIPILLEYILTSFKKPQLSFV